MTSGRLSGSPSNSESPRRALLWAWALVATVSLLALWLLPRWTAIPEGLLETDLVMPQAPPDRLVLVRSTFEQLPGFAQDSLVDALPALRRSCARFRFLGSERTLRPSDRGGSVADWLPLCDPLLAVSEHGGADRSEQIREILREHAVPLQVLNNTREEGLFTGYYEPTLQGSRRRSDRFKYPLYRHPGDIIGVDLGAFHEDLAGRRVSGRLQGKSLEPYFDRAAIETGALSRRGLELVWVDDAVDSFFLHIQGSGRVELAGGGIARVGYAGQNGHPYYAIGRELVVRDGVDPKDVSMQSIRAWLDEHPDVADEVMNTNASYVFFRELRGEGPLGSQSVPLEPGRSLAVDRRHHPLGAPIWLDVAAPTADPAEGDQTLRRLVVAQDTGGAIRGPVRGDVFWGGGADAAEIAGRMKHSGRMWVLYPTELAERILAAQAAQP